MSYWLSLLTSPHCMHTISKFSNFNLSLNMKKDENRDPPSPRFSHNPNYPHQKNSPKTPRTVHLCRPCSLLYFDTRLSIDIKSADKKMAALAWKFTDLVPATSAMLFASWFVAAKDRTTRQAGQSISDLCK